MYVRYNVDKLGRVNLEQLLTFADPQSGKKESKWEKVLTTGLGNNGVELPLGTISGIFLIHEINIVGNKEIQSFFPISPFSIIKITEDDKGRTRIDLFDKRFYFINISMIEFMNLYIKVSTKTSVVIIDKEGNITNK